MGILSGMLLAAGVAFFSKKKLAAQKNDDTIQKENLPELHEKIAQSATHTDKKTKSTPDDSQENI